MKNEVDVRARLSALGWLEGRKNAWLRHYQALTPDEQLALLRDEKPSK